ncbi:peptidase M10A [Branchiostoma belcheri]|nr:peptidase M10A [Branchiostoma belcheri]
MRGFAVVLLAVCLCVLSVPGHARPTRRCSRQRSLERAVFGRKIFVGNPEDLPEGEDGARVSSEEEEDELCEEEDDASSESEELEWSEDDWSESWEEEWGDVEDDPSWDEGAIGEEFHEWGEEESIEENSNESNETKEEDSSESDETSEVSSESDGLSDESVESSEEISDESVESSEETSDESVESSEENSESDETSDESAESSEVSEESEENVSVSDESSSEEEGRRPQFNETDEKSSEQNETGSPETPLTRSAAQFESLADNRFLVSNLTDGMMYLRDFGWFEPDERFDMITDTRTMSPVMRRAITNFQKFAGIEETGELDEKTRETMRMPRCGFADTGKKLASYTTLGSRWRKNDLTYRILNFTPDLPRADVEREMKRALETWSEYTPLRFRRLTGSTRSDIEISFASYGHGDGNSFDGPGSTLAHAYGPGNGIGGDSHFDESETWTINRGNSRPRGIDLHQVAAHEFGHALGLGHSQVNTALMAPFYRYQSDFRLDADDIRGIQRLYAQMPTLRPPPPPGGDRDAVTCSGEALMPSPVWPTDRCRYFWRLNSAGADPGYPQLIADVWDGLPADGIDAALMIKASLGTILLVYRGSHTRFPKKSILREASVGAPGDQFWRYDGASLDSGYPRSIRLWRTVPNIDSALYFGEWQDRSRAYFFKGDQYWRYTQGPRRQDRGYPKALSLWRGFPDRLDAAIQWTNGLNYIFKGDQYWRLDSNGAAVTNAANPPYPRSVAKYWMGC